MESQSQVTSTSMLVLHVLHVFEEKNMKKDARRQLLVAGFQHYIYLTLDS